MGIAAYNRGSRIVERVADEHLVGTSTRADHQATKDESAQLRAKISRLERDLGRARRCLAAERLAREMRVAELKDELRASNLCISILCRFLPPWTA